VADFDERFIRTHSAAAATHQNPTGSVRQAKGQITRMVTSLFSGIKELRNNYLLFCFILMLVMPAFAAPPGGMESSHVTTVVRPDPKTGRLVRTAVAPPHAVASASGTDFVKMVDHIAGEQGVESPLVHSVIREESNYDPNAVSPKGALGVMQLIPATARRFGVTNVFDPEENIQGGVRYLRFLLDYYQSDYPKAIAAYNAGEAAVDKYHGIPPYAETQTYVSRVAKNLKVARQYQSNSAVATATQVNTETAKLETSRPIRASVGSDGRIYYRTP
jgi:hypothetical protein